MTAHGIPLPRAVVSAEQIIDPRFQWEVDQTLNADEGR
jgi:hypothetical protein